MTDSIKEANTYTSMKQLTLKVSEFNLSCQCFVLYSHSDLTPQFGSHQAFSLFLADLLRLISLTAGTYKKNHPRDIMLVVPFFSQDYNPWGGLDRKEKAEVEADLRSRGLCLVPVSCTPQVYRDSNGPDYWTPPYRSCLYR